MKDVQMTFRVEPELRDSFTEAAELEHRPAAQVLRELMRAYIEQVRERKSRAAADDLISAAERRRREKAVEFARASVGLEGFKVSAEDEALARRFIDGEIELQDFVNGVGQVGQTDRR